MRLSADPSKWVDEDFQVLSNHPDLCDLFEINVFPGDEMRMDCWGSIAF